MSTIQDIAAQFDRLCPSQVDGTLSQNGRREAGHVGHDMDGVLSIGWYCDGGNVGESVCEIPSDSIDALFADLAQRPDGSLDAGGIDQIVKSHGGIW